LIVLVWIAALSIVGSLERWTARSDETSRMRGTRWRFAGYRIMLTLVAGAALVAVRLTVAA
jgi:hypothetical protein